MRRELRDELVRSFLAINALLRLELKAARRQLAARNTDSEHKYNPNWRLQPRAPRGTPEGGQWTGDTSPQPARQPTQNSPRQPRPNTTRPVGRLPAPRGDAPENTSLPLRLFTSSPVALAAPLYGDTPRPRIATRTVPGTDDLLLVVYTDGASDRQFAGFQRIVEPERREPILALGVQTGFVNVTPARTQVLNVDVRIVGEDVVFDPSALAAAYGQHIPGITLNTPQGVITRT